MSAPRAHTFRIDAQSAASRLVKTSLHRQPLHARQHRGNHRKGRPSKRILCRHALTSLRATQVTNFEIFLFRGLNEILNQDPNFGPGNRSLYGRTEDEETYIFKFSFPKSNGASKKNISLLRCRTKCSLFTPGDHSERAI